MCLKTLEKINFEEWKRLAKGKGKKSIREHGYSGEKKDLTYVVSIWFYRLNKDISFPD